MKNKIKHEERKISRFSWVEFILIFIGFAIFAALPGIMYGFDSGVFQIIGDYLIWYLLYCALLAVVFCIFTSREKYKSFDVPMNLLSAATKKVSEGDFSVYIKPIHTIDKTDYVDQMFHDFNIMVKELGSLETMKTDFVSSVSHEIKTPLAIIQNYASYLQNPNISDEERTKYIKVILNASKNLNNLVSNILTLNKLENQGIIAPPESYDVCGQLAENILMLETVFAEKELILDIDIEDRAYIQADQALMQLVWRNLFSNAIKFSKPQGHIKLRQTSTAHEICVTISDEGEGMNEETQRRLFEKFYQGDSSHSKDGNGLGLSLVSRVIEMMNGRIEVKSKLGVGTAFTVYLKAAE